MTATNSQLMTVYWLIDWLLNCCWSSSAKWSLIPSPKGPMTLFRSMTALGAFTWLLADCRFGVRFYDGRFTANQFVLAPTPLETHDQRFFQLNICGHSPYVTSHLTRGWVTVDSESGSELLSTDGLPPINSSWRQAPSDSRPEILYSNWTLAVTVLM
jgi:hypothetical protein